ncbi:hypothetical protein AGDE_01505 [Angomonas deanei]|uniref:Uncharacterized protein n=1 Tax=Angomonas deanei TaxID=59799 RepID=A0A7G2CSW5_9TRYP|nr:hypothetical protein AGDE_01505 [Angomonas deanei]CAD2221513.1 hypothetical protein, conserved [Angomonas deanei]|eukprot:EPY42418.1 hypothetical protein AGDE_01505 [Angomonas deanei]
MSVSSTANYAWNGLRRYGLVFMCAASVLAILNDGGSSKEQWNWMRRQYDERRIKNGKEW